MRSLVGLCLLGLLSLHSSVFRLALGDQPGVLIFCDDPSVETAVTSALTSFNTKISTGHKLALYQILSASKSENGSDSVYWLKFNSRRSNCPAGSSTPWTDCDYLPAGRQEPISCNATVYMTETEAETKQVYCKLDDYVVKERAPCMGCPIEIEVNSEDLKVPLSISISKYNTMSDSTHLFTLHDVGHATRQVVAGFRYKVRFDMKKTICSKAEHKDLSDLCVPDDQNPEFANCNSTVDVAPWRFEVPQAQLECGAGPLPTMLIIRRRPPGWSPLRHFLYKVPSVHSTPATSPPSPPSSPSATKASVKEESSEEDTTASKPPSAPGAATDSVMDSPFHCPSKPWKLFNAPTKAATEEGSPQPTVAGAFSDLDLLG